LPKLILPTPPGARVRLIAIAKARSFQSGREFKLASGRISTLYFNMKPTMLDAEGAYLAAALMLDALADDPATHVGGLEMGAVPLVAAVAAISAVRGEPRQAVFIRKAAKDHGTQSLIEGLPLGETIAGRTVVVLEDVTTTGGSSLKAVAVLREAGATVTRVLTLLDRQEGAEAAFAAAGVKLNSILRATDFTGDSNLFPAASS